jgi:threonine dehydrogenase-like Zn-dependent dehydrogenase
VCGSDLHLYHGEIMQMKEGEVLGHELMGIVEKTGPKVTKVKTGDRVVASFNIGCGTCQYCKKKQFTACDCTNNSSVMEKLYGHRIAGVLGYSHVSIPDTIYSKTKYGKSH